ncbi:unnamed protein product [Heterobilharzia americana]|nr:unnamed protein product [Heterobilharzia americana]
MLHSIQVVWLTCCLIILSQYCCGVEMIRENGYFRKLVDEQYIKLNNSLNHLLVNNLYTNLILPKSETTCSRDLGHLILGIIQKKSWALQWLDASAHPPAGITGGAMHWTGSYDVCLTCAGYNTTGGLQFQGSYCTMVFYLNISVPIVPQLTTTLGLCMPNSCTSEEVRSIVNTTTYLLFLEMSQNESFCHRPVEDVDKDTWYYIAVSACSILTILVVNATVIDLFLYTKWCRRNQAEISYTGINHIHEENSNENLGTSEDSTQRLIESDGILYNENQVNSIPSVGEKHNQTFLEYRKSILERYPPINVVCAFSLPINSLKLYAQHIKEDTEKDDGSNSISFTFLDGIRFLSMIWIIAAHILLHGYKLTNNLKSLAEEFQHVWLFGIYLMDIYHLMYTSLCRVY